MNLLPHSFRVRLTLWYVLALAVILAVFSLALALTLDHTLDARLDDDLRFAAQQVQEEVSLQNGQPQLTAKAAADLQNLSDRGFLVRVVDNGGTIVSASGPFQQLKPGAPPQTGAPLFTTSAAPTDGSPLRLYTTPLVKGGQRSGFIEVGASLKPIQDTQRQLGFTLALAIPLTLLLASVGGLFLASRALNPIDRITRAARNVGATNLAQRLNLSLPDDELGRLARTFDAMLERLNDAFARQRQFTADASHELRTPLAIIKGDIGVALNRPRDPAEYVRTLGSVEEEVDRLTRLVDDLLLLARADNGQNIVRAEPLEVSGVLGLVVEQVRPLAAAKAQSVVVQAPDGLLVYGDLDKLLRLFLNLLDNAVKYTPANGHITVRASAKADGTVIEVVDSGPGIAADQSEQIFSRFHRADTERTSAQSGWGLGLPIARSIAVAHNGSLTVRNNPDGGSVFVVRLPLYTA